MKFIRILILFIIVSEQVFSQKQWTLDKCIEYARENSITIKEYKNKIKQLKIDGNTIKNSYLPNLSYGTTQKMDFGRSLTSTNIYQDVNAQTSSFSVSSEIELFAGFKTKNSIKKNKYDLLTAEANREVITNDLTLNVTFCYFQVLLDRQELEIAKQQVKLTEEQVTRTKILLKNGKIAGSDLYDARAQLATDQLIVTEAQNTLQLAILDLAQAMNLPSTDSFIIADVCDDLTSSDITSVNNVISSSYACMPQIKQAEYAVKASEYKTKVARAGYYPTLTLDFGVSSGYYYINSSDNQSFNNQMKNNLQKSIYITLNVPLFDRHSTRNKIRSAKVEEDNSHLALEKVKKELYKNIEKAYCDVIGACEKYKSTEKAVSANQESFRYAIEKFNAGKYNSYEYNQSRTKLADALSKQAQAKYSCLLKRRIFDFYACMGL